MTEAIAKIDKAATTSRKNSRDSALKYEKHRSSKVLTNDEDSVDISDEARNRAGLDKKTVLQEYLNGAM